MGWEFPDSHRGAPGRIHHGDNPGIWGWENPAGKGFGCGEKAGKGGKENPWKKNLSQRPHPGESAIPTWRRKVGKSSWDSGRFPCPWQGWDWRSFEIPSHPKFHQGRASRKQFDPGKGGTGTGIFLWSLSGLIPSWNSLLFPSPLRESLKFGWKSRDQESPHGCSILAAFPGFG